MRSSVHSQSASGSNWKSCVCSRSAPAILILDEPTTGISLPQRTKLFETLNMLVREGLTVVFVTHNLEDARELCASVTVLRFGRVVGELTRPFETGRLVELMFGQSLAGSAREAVDLGKPVLELHDACVSGDRLRVPDINLQVYAGEVIGLAGMEGSGQHLLLRACAGLDRLAAGEIRIAGMKMNRRAYGEFLDRGVAYLPAGRLEEGLVPGLNLTEHFILAKRTKDFFIDWNQAQLNAQEKINAYSIRGTPGSRVESLSGGNQQRALLALLHPDLKLVLLDHPTRGLDIESTRWVWNQSARAAQIRDLNYFRLRRSRRDSRAQRPHPGFLRRPRCQGLNAKETSVRQLGELIGGKRP